MRNLVTIGLLLVASLIGCKKPSPPIDVAREKAVRYCNGPDQFRAYVERDYGVVTVVCEDGRQGTFQPQ